MDMREMEIQDDVLLFGGFVLTHAAYSICDAPEGELLIPLVVSESPGKRDIRRFEAATQAEAVENAKTYVALVRDQCDLWAFAREGSMEAADGPVDVISVSLGSSVCSHDVTLVQPFRPNNGRDQFAMYPEMMIVVDGAELPFETAEELLSIVLEGAEYHPHHGLWSLWLTRGEGPSTPAV